MNNFFSNPQRMIQLLLQSKNPIEDLQNTIEMSGDRNLISAFQQAKVLANSNPSESLPMIAQSMAKSMGLDFNQVLNTAKSIGMPLNI